MPLLSFELPDINPQPGPSPVTRYAWAWPVVYVLFFLLVALELAAYFTQGNADPDGTNHLAKELRTYVRQKALAVAKDEPENLAKGLNKVTVALHKEKKSSEAVLGKSRLMLVAGYEIDRRKPDPAALKFLRESKDDRNIAFATLYGDPPKKWKSEEIARRIGDRNFNSKLAQVHAYEIQGDKGARNRILGDPNQTKVVLTLLVLGLLGAGLTSVVLWILFFIRSGTGALRPKGFPLQSMALGEADSLGVRVLLYLGSFLILPLMLSLALGPFVKQDTRSSLLLSVAGMAIVAAALAVILSMKLQPYSLGLRRAVGQHQPFHRLLGLGVVGACMNLIPFFIGALISMVLMLFLPEASHPASEIIQSEPGGLEILLIMTSACIFAPILEEIVFRGLIGPALARKLNSPAAGIIVSAALFASIHPQGIAGWPPLFALGTMFGLVTYYTKSLVPSMVMHSLNNGLVLLAGLFIT